MTLEDIATRLTLIEAKLDALMGARADDMLSVAQAAEFLGCTPLAVYHIDIPRYKSGSGGKTSRCYFRRADLIAYLQDKRVASRREAQAQRDLKALDY